MSDEQMILARLEGIETQVRQLAKASESMAELRRDLSPLVNSTVRILMQELGEVEFGFQLEDFFALLKRGLRSVRNLTYTLEQLDNLIEMWRAMEPMLKSTVPNLIKYFDSMERKGVFRTYAAMLEVRAKVAAHYGAEEIAAMGDGFVLILGLLKTLSNPETVQFINRVMDLPSEVRLEEAEPVSLLGLFKALGSRETRQGLGVMLELTRALGTLKGNGGRVPVSQETRI